MTIETVEQLREFVESLAGYIKSCNQELEHEEYLSNNRFATRNGLKMAQALTFALGEIEKQEKLLNDMANERLEGEWPIVKQLHDVQEELDRIKNVDVKYLQTQIIFGCDCTKPAIAREVAQAVKDFIIKGE